MVKVDRIHDTHTQTHTHTHACASTEKRRHGRNERMITKLKQNHTSKKEKKRKAAAPSKGGKISQRGKTKGEKSEQTVSNSR